MNISHESAEQCFDCDKTVLRNRGIVLKRASNLLPCLCPLTEEPALTFGAGIISSQFPSTLKVSEIIVHAFPA